MKEEDSTSRKEINSTGKTANMKNINSILTAVIMLLWLPLNVAAQQKVTVSGTVKDNLGEAMEGALVMVKGEKTGAVTDRKGSFVLTVQSGSTLVIDMMGYKSMEYKITRNIPNLNIILEEDPEQLDAVVVTIAYGSTH